VVGRRRDLYEVGVTHGVPHSELAASPEDRDSSCIGFRVGTVLSTPSTVKEPELKLCFPSRREIAFSRSRSNRGHLDVPHRGFAADTAASRVVLGQAIELL
jgi:hypothetical protein